MVKFLSIDKDNRKATFDVDGVEITRGIPLQFEGSIDEYLLALAKGLDIEFAPTEEKAIETPIIQPGAEIIPDGGDGEGE